MSEGKQKEWKIIIFYRKRAILEFRWKIKARGHLDQVSR